jgi:hypothetical protein
MSVIENVAKKKIGVMWWHENENNQLKKKEMWRGVKWQNSVSALIIEAKSAKGAAA